MATGKLSTTLTGKWPRADLYRQPYSADPALALVRALLPDGRRRYACYRREASLEGLRFDSEGAGYVGSEFEDGLGIPTVRLPDLGSPGSVMLVDLTTTRKQE